MAIATPRKPVPTRLRWKILKRDNFACRYCGGSPPDVRLAIDHLQPLAKGGDALDRHNLVTACMECNRAKHAQEIEYELEELPRVVIGRNYIDSGLGRGSLMLARLLRNGEISEVDAKNQVGHLLATTGAVMAWFWNLPGRYAKVRDHEDLLLAYRTIVTEYVRVISGERELDPDFIHSLAIGFCKLADELMSEAA